MSISLRPSNFFEEFYNLRILIVGTLVIVSMMIVNVRSLRAQIFGNAIVVDGDTIQVGNIRVRFFGIDAPEKRQTCLTTNDRIYKCGLRSKNYLLKIIGDKPVSCKDLGRAKFGRRWGHCIAGNINLQAAMVRAGHARAYRFHSDKYVVEQNIARERQAGIWQGFHVRPGRFRKCWRKADRLVNVLVKSP